MKISPFNEVVEHAMKVIAEGATVWQQFKCAKCGAKQTMSEQNKFFTSGLCEECGHTTDIVKDGCNFMVMYGGQT